MRDTLSSSDRPLLLVDNDAAFDEFARHWLPRIDGAVVALDTEEDRTWHYHPRVALVQVTIEGEDAILDPVVLGQQRFDAVMEALCLTPSGVILHGGRNDVAGLRRDWGVGPARVLDTQVAARFTGRERFGLSALLEEEFQVEMDKATRRSEWLHRPLTPRQLEYARLDTVWLHELWALLEDQAAESGWADAVEEECTLLAGVAADETTFDPFGWTRIKGMGQRSVTERQRAAALWAWRDGWARQHDMHPVRALPNWAVEQLAIRGPGALRPGSGLRGQLDNHGPDAVEQVRLLLAEPPDLPVTPPRNGSRKPSVPSDTFNARYAALTAWRDETCRETGLEPGWLAPRALLESIARTTATRAEAIASIEGARRWQIARYSDPWLDILQSVS